MAQLEGAGGPSSPHALATDAGHLPLRSSRALCVRVLLFQGGAPARRRRGGRCAQIGALAPRLWHRHRHAWRRHCLPTRPRRLRIEFQETHSSQRVRNRTVPPRPGLCWERPLETSTDTIPQTGLATARCGGLWRLPSNLHPRCAHLAHAHAHPRMLCCPCTRRTAYACVLTWCAACVCAAGHAPAASDSDGWANVPTSRSRASAMLARGIRPPTATQAKNIAH